MGNKSYSDEEIQDMSKKEFRKKFPSGWMEVARYETLVLLIDALLESSPSREFTPWELSQETGSTDKSIERHLGTLVDLGMVEKLESRDPVRYRLNQRNPVTQRLFELNTTVQRVKEGDLEKSLSSSPRKKLVNDFGNRWNDGTRDDDHGFRPQKQVPMIS